MSNSDPEYRTFSEQILHKKTNKPKKKKKSFFKPITTYQGDYWIVTCPKCKKKGLFQAYLSDKKDRLYLQCNYCKALFISPKKVKPKK